MSLYPSEPGHSERLNRLVAESIEQIDVIFDRLASLQIENASLRKVKEEAEIMLAHEHIKRMRHLPLMVAIDEHNRLEHDLIDDLR